MSRVTVRWNKAAEQDLANLWLQAAQPDLIRRAADEVDRLLQVSPSKKGIRFALSRLDQATLATIEQRAACLPEDLQLLRCGPLEFLFVSREDDGMAIVLLVRLRRR